MKRVGATCLGLIGMVCFSPSPLKCFICPYSICPRVLSTLMLAPPLPQTHKQSTAKDSDLCNTIQSGWENYKPGIMGQAFHKGEQQGKKVTGNQEASHLSPCLWRLEVLIQNNLLWRIWGPCIAQAQWERKGRAAPTALQSLSLRDRGHHRCPFGWDCDGDVTPLSWDWAVDL